MNSSNAPIVIIGFIILGGIYLFLKWRDQKAKAELRERGVTTNAKVTQRKSDVQISTDVDNNNNGQATTVYTISFQYAVNGTPYSGSEAVSENVYDVLREGQPIEVVYLPERPGQARLASSL